MGARSGGGAGISSRGGVGATERGLSKALAKSIVAQEKSISGNNYETLKIFDDNGNVVRSVTLSTIKDSKPVTEYVTQSEAEATELDDLESIVAEDSAS